jgi:hypothetical protein
MLGAMGEQLGKRRGDFERLHHSLNPFSKYNFGLFAGLEHAGRWQAKRKSSK